MTTCSWRPRMRRAARKRRATQSPERDCRCEDRDRHLFSGHPRYYYRVDRSTRPTDPDQRGSGCGAGWLTVLRAAAAGTYVASRTRNRPRRAHEPEPVSRSPRCTGRHRPARGRPEQVAPSPAALESEPEDAPEREAPTGAVTMVPVTMEAERSAHFMVLGTAPGPEQLGDHGARPEAPSERVARPIELPRGERPRASTLGALAAVAGVAAVVLGTLAFLSALERDGSADDPAARDARRAIGLLSSRARTASRSRGRAADSSSQSEAAGAACSSSAASSRLRREGPARVWVVGPARGARPGRALLGQREGRGLARPVPEGSSVGVTVEDAVGADAPTQPLRLVASRGE